MKLSPHLYHWLVRPKRYTEKYIHQNIRTHFDCSGKTVLDFGSGTGANCILFDCEHYIGVDPDRRRIRFASKKYPDYAFQPLTGHRLPMNDQAVDYILIISVLHHIPEPDIQKYINEFNRILKSGGTVIVIEPCLSSQRPFTNRIMKLLDRGKHILEGSSYMDAFHQAGYHCEAIKSFTKCMVYHELFFSASVKAYQ